MCVSVFVPFHVAYGLSCRARRFAPLFSCHFPQVLDPEAARTRIEAALVSGGLPLLYEAMLEVSPYVAHI